MAEQKPRIRKITQPIISTSRVSGRLSSSGRTAIFVPKHGGSFTPNELGDIIPPANARAFKIVRVFGGRYVRDDNKQGLGTEGPFDMSEWPDEDSDLSLFEDLEITRVIFDVAP